MLPTRWPIVPASGVWMPTAMPPIRPDQNRAEGIKHESLS